MIPVATRRAVVKLDGKKEENKIRRWQAIAESAAKQSKRMYVPEVRHVMRFSEAVEHAKELDVVLLPYELAKDMKETKKIIDQIEPGQSIGIFIGPEGGFDEEEVRMAADMGAKTNSADRDSRAYRPLCPDVCTGGIEWKRIWTTQPPQNVLKR